MISCVDGRFGLGKLAAHAAARARGPVAAGARAAQRAQQRVFFVSVFRPSGKNQPTTELCAALPRAQAATWAWAGKVVPRLGRFWPNAVAPDLDRSSISNG